MKYVRTRDTIYEIVEDRHDNMWLVVKEHKPKDYNIKVSLLRAVKQADTIEDLCDLIFCWRGKHWGFFMPIELEMINKEKWEKIYGAIFTDKGLIYVAKMNKRGKLELL